MILIIDQHTRLHYHLETDCNPNLENTMKRIFASSLLLLMSAQVLAADLLNANSATEAQLAAVAALDDQTVEAIVAARPFADVGELDRLLAASLNEDEREAAYAAVFVPVNLNTASRENILLIPGVGRKMAHEFEEYRPYSSMEQFRREIGKYVDDEEVARLEMYVTLD